jgi:predicted SnoaL-like aldol condensation-catalyzing enzyme
MSPTRLSRLEAPTRIVLQFNDAFNRHDISGMMDLMTEDCIFENTDPAPDGIVYSGRDSVARFWQNFFLQSPNAYIEIEEIFGIGYRCIMRWKYSWIDEEGRRGHVRGVDIYKTKNGRISEKFSYVKG